MGDARAEHADAQIAEFITGDPRYAVDREQPAYRGGTNCCTFGTHDGRPIVFKTFRQPERQRHEASCLRHLASTGLVPRIIGEREGTLIAMERLPGRDGVAPDLEEIRRQRLSTAFGRALGALAATPLPQAGPGYDPARDFSILPWDPQPARAVARYVANARRVAEVVPACRTEFCRRSLDRLEAAVPRVAGEPRMLFHEDIANFRSDGEGFVGFFDLEMCRVGTPSMQLAMAFGLCADGRLRWEPLQRGFAERGGAIPDRESLAAMGLLYHWIRICRWGWWDGDPQQEHHLRDAIADAPCYIEGMAKLDASFDA